MFWTNTTAPKLNKTIDAQNPALVASRQGWVNPKTGEVVIAVRGLTSKNGDAAAAPTLTLTAPANATYTATQVLTFTLGSSAALAVVDVPYLELTINGRVKKALYTSAGSTSTSLKFAYTVVAEDVQATPAAIACKNSLNAHTNGRKKGRLTYAVSGRQVPVAETQTFTVPSLANVKV